jgi:gluconokinase
MAILVIDIGSSSVRALVFSAETLQVLAQTSSPYRFTTEPTGAAIIDPLLLREATESCIDRVLAEHDQQHGEPIEAVGLDTFVGNLLGVVGNTPTTPVFTYADTRSAPDVDMLRSQIDVAATHQRTGCMLHTAYAPARLHWLYREQLTGSTTRWLDIGTFLYEAWFGREVPCSYSVSAWNGLLNRESLTWDAEWLNLLNLDSSMLPDLADFTSVQQGLTTTYAQRWPVLANVPFCLAVGDGAAANIGSGAVSPAQIALTVGTTAALRRVSTEALPPVPAGLWAYRIDAPHHLIGGATTEGGNIFQWARRTLTLPADLESQLQSAVPDSHGLTFLPLLAGERSPGWEANAVGTVTGLRLSSTPVDIVQAALEGVALRLSIVMSLIDRSSSNQTAIYASGGALNASPAWTQIMADALNRPLHLIAEEETTARGTVLLVLYALKRCQLTDFPPRVERVFEPRPDAVERLQQAKMRQVALYNQQYGKSK